MWPTIHGVVSQQPTSEPPPEPGTNYKHYRFLFRNNNSHSNIQISEAELHSTIGGSTITTGGTPTASSTFSGYPASNAFDGNTSTFWASNNLIANEWLAYELGTAQPVTEYTLRANTQPNAAPSEWKLQGSNDGSSWTTLDYRTAQTAWSANEQRTFTTGYTPPANAYRYWRLNITANNGDARVGTRQLALRTVVSGPQVALAAVGTPSNSSTFGGTYVPARAFGAALDNDGWLSSGGVPQWLQYDFGEHWPQAIVEYGVAISGASVPANKSANTWTLQASNDGSNWDTIDSRSGQTSWSTDELRVFTL